MGYLVHVLALILIYGALAYALNLISGYTGLLSLAHAGIFGVGAYAYTVTATRWLPLWGAIAAAVLLGAVLGLVVAGLSVRTHDDSFVLTTFALQIVLSGIFINWTEVTGGSLGLRRIPRPEFLGDMGYDEMWELQVALVVFSLLLGCTALISASPFGRTLRGIRQDEDLVRVRGRPVTQTKIIISTLSGGLAAGCGIVYALVLSYLDPSAFSVGESIFILSIVIIGGAGTVAGPALGAAVLVGVPELLRFMGVSAAVTGHLRQSLYGILLILILRFQPGGIVGLKNFWPTKDNE